MGLVYNTGAEALSRHYVVATTVGKSHLCAAAIVADIDQVRLGDNLAVSAVSTAQADAGAKQFCRKHFD